LAGFDENLNVLDRRCLALRHGDALPVDRCLRDESPAHWDEKGQAWCLSRHEDVNIHMQRGFVPDQPPSTFVCGFLYLLVEFTPA
jgi:hypothetical protein